MIDVFHVFLEENPKTFYTELSEHSSYIKHVHFAGPDRRAPKDGEINYKKIFETLKQKDYRGFFSIEAIAKPSFEKLAEESIYYLDNLF
jgi:sugar phosphate isomerase/epimerase